MLFNKKAKPTSDANAPKHEITRPETPIPLRQKLPFSTVPPAQQTSGRFEGSGWSWTRYAPSHAKPWPELPLANQSLLIGTACCTFWLLGRVAVPLIYAAGASAIFPYTAEGKQQTCLDNLRAIQQAVAMYAQDYDGRLPQLDEVSAGKRVTWVSLVQPKTNGPSVQCPTGPAVSVDKIGLISSYVLNPVLAEHRVDEADHPDQTLLLADGGNRHDVSLLPPLPTWPSVSFLSENTSTGFDDKEANLGFRHWNGSQQMAGAVYADGHAQPIANDGTTRSSLVWGGSMAARASMRRIEGASSVAQEFVGLLREAKVGPASRQYQEHRKALDKTCAYIVALWQMNRDEQASDSVDAIGWRLTRALEAAGNPKPRQQLNEELSHRVKEVLQQAKATGTQNYSTDDGFQTSLPAGWTREVKQSGRYQSVYVRSPLRDLYALMEVGNRATYIEPRSVAWEGSERDLKRRYGPKGYKRLAMQSGMLLGNNASLWEYEIEKPGSPRLHKVCIGYDDGWRSVVLGFTAPDKDWKSCQSIFRSAKNSFSNQEQ